jgi:hypothetical protein
MNGAEGPDILGVCEVENAFALEALTARLNGQLNNRNYDIVHADATREQGDVERAQTAVRFYNLAWRYLEQWGQDHRGDPKLVQDTLYYRGNGSVFDQFWCPKGS